MIIPDLPAYFESWSEEINSRANRVRNLIGAKHWLSDGFHKEFVIKEFLLRHLPKTLSISRGFIRSAQTDNISPENDLLITDPNRHVAFFNEGDLQIVPPDSVLATLEVKSTYRTATLKEALQNVIRTRAIVLNSIRNTTLWSGIVFITGDVALGPQKIGEEIKSTLQSAVWWKESIGELDLDDRRSGLPCVVVVLDLFLILLDIPDQGFVRIRVFSAGALSVAIGFSLLFSNLKTELSGNRVASEFDKWMLQLDGLGLTTMQAEIPQ